MRIDLGAMTPRVGDWWYCDDQKIISRDEPHPWLVLAEFPNGKFKVTNRSRNPPKLYGGIFHGKHQDFGETCKLNCDAEIVLMEKTIGRELFKTKGYICKDETSLVVNVENEIKKSQQQRFPDPKLTRSVDSD